ncbi:DUF3265 domain-containing protein [Vibrio metschnikovii]|nr:DUF3265 domain-containing protein [Vibrio metschnikovii]
MARNARKGKLTRRSRGIRNAWHFRYALILLVFSAMRKVGRCVAHPLTRRYISLKFNVLQI